MSMEKEWEELANFLVFKLGDGPLLRAIQGKMRELERRNLPERLADVVVRFNAKERSCAHYAHFLVDLGDALRTGDLSEIQKWVK